MTADPIVPRSRRALLAAGLGGLVAAGAAAIGRPLPAQAANGDPLILCQANTATSTTTLTVDTTNGFVVDGGANTTSAAIKGTSGSNVGAGVFGEADPGSFAMGVRGVSDVGAGVVAETTTGDAVWARSVEPGSRAVYAQSTDGYAVWADSGDTGVQAQGASFGVTAYSETGTGLVASSDAATKPAAIASTSKHTGLIAHYGASVPAGFVRTALYAHSDPTGTALRTQGHVRFSSAGLATIAAGTRSVTVNPGMDITASSKVLVTLQSSPGGTTTIQRVARNTTANTFTIWLTANATANTTAAWFLIS